MSVYIIAAPAVGLVKIGYAASPFARLSALRTASPVELRLEAVIPGSRDNERQLHSRFSALHSHGEWFRSDDEIHELIAGFRVEKQSLRRRYPKSPSANGSEFPAEQNVEWLRVYHQLSALGRPVSRAQMDAALTAPEPESRVA